VVDTSPSGVKVGVAPLTGVSVAKWAGVAGNVTVGRAVGNGSPVAVPIAVGRIGVSTLTVADGVIVISGGGKSTDSGAKAYKVIPVQ